MTKSCLEYMGLNMLKSMEISGLDTKSQSFILLRNIKMPAIVGIFTFMSRINLMLS